MVRAVGIDVSKHQGIFNPDHAIKQIDFVIQRASWALTKDERFKIIWQGVQQFERRGAYHYYSSGVPWRAQADLLLNVTAGKDFKVLIVDYEAGYNNLNERTALELAKFLNYLIERRPGIKILVYSNSYAMRDLIIPYVDISHIDWWASFYPLFPKPQTWQPKKLIELNRPWKFGQYTKKGKGADYGCAEQYVDLDVFNGTVEELNIYFGIGTVPSPPPPDCDVEVNQALDKVIQFTKDQKR